jgi:hypothetical protein
VERGGVGSDQGREDGERADDFLSGALDQTGLSSAKR